MKTKILLLCIMLFGMIGLSLADMTSVNINSPSNESWYTRHNMIVTFNATANTSTFDCTIEFNGTNYYSGTSISNNTETTVLLSSVTAEMTQGILNVSCSDDWETLNAGHNVSTDFTAPNIYSLSSNSTNDRVNNISGSINLTIGYVEANFDNISASANYTYEVNSFTCSTNNCSLIANWSMLGCSASATSCTVIIKAIDSANNNAWDSITLYLNTTKPAISQISWSDTDLISNSTNNYIFSLTYNISWLNNVTITNASGHGGVTMSCSGGTCTLTDNLSEYGCVDDGSCIINATLFDVFGEVSNENMTITIDDTTPVVNDTIITNETNNWFEYGDSIFFRVNVSDSNMFMCYLEGNEMTNGTVVVGDTSRWNYTSTNIKDCSGNCTYCQVDGYCDDKAGNRVEFGVNITIIPCIENCNVTVSSSSATSSALSITLNDSLLSETIIWMVPQSYNTTHGQCNYNISNAQKYIIYNATINLTYAATQARCNISIIRNATDTGVVEVSINPRLDITQPSSIPAAVIGALTIIVILSHIIASREST